MSKKVTKNKYMFFKYDKINHNYSNKNNGNIIIVCFAWCSDQ